MCPVMALNSTCFELECSHSDLAWWTYCGRSRAIEMYEIFGGFVLHERISVVRGPNFTKLGEDIRPSRMVTELVSELRYLAPFLNAVYPKLSDVENVAKFRIF